MLALARVRDELPRGLITGEECVFDDFSDNKLICICIYYSTPRRGVDHWVTLRGAELSERVRSRGACFADRKTLYWIPSEMSVRLSVCLSEVISSRAYFAAQNKNGQNESTVP